MQLTLLPNTHETLDNTRIRLSKEAVALSEVATVTLKSGSLQPTLGLYGRIMIDEGQRKQLSTNYPGRLEALYVYNEGAYIRPGQAIARLYAPALQQATEELLRAMATDPIQTNWLNATKQKLHNWGLTRVQIAQLQAKRKSSPYIDVLATYGGRLLKKLVNEGEHLRAGQALIEVAALSPLWAYFEATTSDIPWLKIGMTIPFRVLGPQTSTLFKGRIQHISAVLQENQTVEVQAIIKQPAHLLPGTHVYGELTVPTQKEGLLLPQSAVLWTGKRSVVYVAEKSTPTTVSFAFREVALGPRFGAHYLVQAGLQEGEKVVSAGALAVDANMQLHGKVHMMRPPHHLVGDSVPPTSSDTRLEAYFNLTEALISADVQAAQAATKTLLHALQKNKQTPTSEKLLIHLSPLLLNMQKAHTLVNLRQAYGQLSEILIDASPNWSGKKALYVLYCPMALGNKGGQWLWHKKEVRNPYFGASMLTCGRVVKQVSQEK